VSHCLPAASITKDFIQDLTTSSRCGYQPLCAVCGSNLAELNHSVYSLVPPCVADVTVDCALCRQSNQRTLLFITPSYDLVIFINSDLSMQTRARRTVAGCFAVLRRLRSVRRFVPSLVDQTSVAALVLSRLDYVNATLAVFRPVHSTVSSPFSTPQLGRSLVFDARLTSRTLLTVMSSLATSTRAHQV